ncbi:MAG: hypothetical protein QXW62_06230 [Candidatus Methanomethylicaceae archaeon]|nr:hypothetical protein [Candidatus Verstraetearchaeota archaeon]
MNKKTYFTSTISEKDEAMRQTIRNLMSSMETNTENVELIISRFENRLENIMKRLENLEDRVANLERKVLG